MVDESRNDIFRYRALLPVSNLDLASPLRVGQTPLYEAPRLGAAAGLNRLFIKDDGQNPSASFKDRAGAVALVRARETGVKVICGASTGNAGSSMACLAASVGMPCVIFVPEKAPAAKIAQLLIFGAKVLAVKGTYDDAFDLCMEVCDKRGWFNRNTGHNPFTRDGKKTAAFEIYEQLGEIPDWVSVPTGDGNIIAGIWKGFCDLKEAGIVQKTPKMLCAQSELSASISQTAWKLQKSGISAPVWKDVVVDPVRPRPWPIPSRGHSPGRVGGGSHRHWVWRCRVTVPDADILSAIPEIARGAGVFVEPAAACAWAGLKKAAQEGIVKPDETVVCMCTGNGLKDVAAARKVAGNPIPVEANADATMSATDGWGED